MYSVILALLMFFIPADDEKILVLTNANLVDVKNQQVHYGKNIYLRGQDIWKITPVKRSDRLQLTYSSIDMSGKFVMPAHTDLAEQLQQSTWPSLLIDQLNTCLRSDKACELIKEGQNATMIVLLDNPFENLGNQIEGVVLNGQWHAASVIK
jgi:hypothetical protein